MPKVITLETLNVKTIALFRLGDDSLKLAARWELADATGEIWERGEDTFFETMPPQKPIYDSVGHIIGYQEHPENWHELTAQEANTLNSIFSRAENELSTRLLDE